MRATLFASGTGSGRADHALTVAERLLGAGDFERGIKQKRTSARLEFHRYCCDGGVALRRSVLLRGRPPLLGGKKVPKHLRKERGIP